ncbi:hypothetical protein UFOVP59_62 [uncultured Caudovirales phage]|uniref:Uncharacterized protein n=1 Tax=uncultured Caudovirales phage TaxID=2100421 RepID=A0A6J7WVN4_9CAUD|nr:hypothetical protein UFOVP59_62 [uncultured Caudovirales phage]CAB5220895.1 hypothetical protein UFOVP246_53 [uncultured Caudovirales phage]
MLAAIVVSLWGLVALLVLIFQVKMGSKRQEEIKDLKRAEEIHTNAEKSRSDPLPADIDASLQSLGKLRD